MIVSNRLIDGRYTVIDEVGSGGMGTVYKARDLLTREIIALKYVLVDRDATTRDQTLIISNSSTTNFNVVLANEFKIMASMRHPHIISVLDYGFHQG